MRYCVDPAHTLPDDRQSPWIQDDEPDHEHPKDKPRMRYLDGEWRHVDEEST